MYNAFFKLAENPFSLSPDPSFLFRSPQHEEALAALIYGVQSRKGFVVLTGEVGTGKTTMLECLRDFLDSQRLPYASICNSRLSVEQFFEMIAHDFGFRTPRSKTEVLFALERLLGECHQRGRTAALIIDEAHNLEWDVLEEIRLLGNMETRHSKLLQIILAGQQELDSKLGDPAFRQLKQRLVLRCNLQPFQLSETIDYINTRLARAGMKDQTVFPRELLIEIHRWSKGIPRLINAICDNLLLTAFAMETKVATLEMLEEVSADLRLESPMQESLPLDPSISGGGKEPSYIRGK